MNGHDVLAVDEEGSGRQGQFSVMLRDCERLRLCVEDVVRGLDEGRDTYEQLVHGMCVAGSVERTIGSGWNCQGRYDPDTTSLLHYTDMNRRYWVATTNSPTDLCRVSLRRALATSFISRVELQHEVATGHVCPSLTAQINAAVDNPAELHVAMRHLDCAVVAPYRRLAGHRWRRWAFMRRLVRTLLQPR